jgi:hypothetical protein
MQELTKADRDRLLRRRMNYGATPPEVAWLLTNNFALDSTSSNYLPARFARPASGIAVVFMGEYRTSTIIAARYGTHSFGARFVHVQSSASYFFSVQRRDNLRCLIIIRHFNKSEAASPPGIPVGDNLDARDLTKRFDE